MLNLHEKINFDGKVVLVTGSTRGIGHEVTRAFFDHGARVVVNGRQEETVLKVVQALDGTGNRAFGISADVGKKAEAERMIRVIVQKWGRLDVVVNNASIGAPQSIEEVSEKEWEEVLHTNLGGAFWVSRAAALYMKEREGGSIVMLGSQAAYSGSKFGGPHYTASKGGILALTFSFAREFGPYQVRVNALLPGLIWTDITAGAKQEEWYQGFLRDTPLARAGESREVAGACLFLASDLASFMTGQGLSVNGGIT